MCIRIHRRISRRRLRNIEELIPLKEWCEINHLSVIQARLRLQRGLIVGRKFAGRWYLHPDPYQGE